MLSKIFIAVLAVLVVSACSPVSMSADEYRVKKAVKNMTYTKDPRTGLCFGIIFTISGLTDFGSISATNVPCDKVEKYLIE